MKPNISISRLSRRRFVATAVGALAGVGTGATAAGIRFSAGRMPEAHDFASATGQQFQLADGSMLRLASVDLRDPSSSSRFSLMFEGAAKHAESAIYSLRHPRLGKMDLFLTPVGLPDSHGQHPLEAVMEIGQASSNTHNPTSLTHV